MEGPTIIVNVHGLEGNTRSRLHPARKRVCKFRNTINPVPSEQLPLLCMQCILSISFKCMSVINIPVFPRHWNVPKEERGEIFVSPLLSFEWRRWTQQAQHRLLKDWKYPIEKGCSCARHAKVLVSFPSETVNCKTRNSVHSSFQTKEDEPEH